MKTREQIEARLKVVDEILNTFNDPTVMESPAMLRIMEEKIVLNWVLKDEEEND